MRTSPSCLEVLGLHGRRDVVVVERLDHQRLAGPAVAVLGVVQADVFHPQRGLALELDGGVDEGDLARLIYKAPASGHVVPGLLEAAVDQPGRIVAGTSFPPLATKGASTTGRPSARFGSRLDSSLA